MRRSIADYFKKKNVSEERNEEEEEVVNEEVLENEGAARISDSGSEEDSDRLETDRGASVEKKKKYCFQQQWLSQFPWLRYENKTMVCVYCSSCGPSVAGRTQFVNGSTQFKIQSVKLHHDSKKHKTCRDRCINRSSQPLPSSFSRIEEASRSAENEEMIIKFNTAYNLAKEELPFTKFKTQIVLMKKNGLNVNPTYANDTACAQFVGVIADTLKGQTADKVASAPYISFMLDGSTDKSTKECELIYARIVDEGKPLNILIGHIEVEHANAEGKQWLTVLYSQA